MVRDELLLPACRTQQCAYRKLNFQDRLDDLFDRFDEEQGALIVVLYGVETD